VLIAVGKIIFGLLTIIVLLASLVPVTRWLYDYFDSNTPVNKDEDEEYLDW
jgi:hypothetical protein